MFRIWGKLIKDNHLLNDYVACRDDDDTRTHHVFSSLEEICGVFDLPVPIWLDQNIRDFKRNDRCRFTQDSFVESIPFEYLEIRVIEE